MGDVINELYDEFVDDTIKKVGLDHFKKTSNMKLPELTHLIFTQGTLMKRRNHLGTYQEKMFILKSSGLGYYYTDPKKLKFVPFDSQTRIEEASSGLESNKPAKLRQFRVVTSGLVLNLATLDKR